MAEYPGPIRMGFRRLRLNVPIHWLDEGAEVSPCGAKGDDDVTTNQFWEDVTCDACRRAYYRPSRAPAREEDGK